MHPVPLPAAVESYETIPPQVQAAFQYLHFAEMIRNQQNCGSMAGDSPREGRDLTKTEAEVYDSALTTLLNYFNEPNFGKPQMGKPPTDEGPEQPEKVPAA
jgi:hypothetical protein